MKTAISKLILEKALLFVLLKQIYIVVKVFAIQIEQLAIAIIS